MANDETYFDLPTTPDAIGVVLPPANLRRIDFTGLDFVTCRRAIIEYIQTYYPNDFNDFVASNGMIMLVEVVAATAAKLALRSDILAQESFLPTAKTEEAVINHLALINQSIRLQTCASVEIQAIIDNTSYTDINIPAGTSFEFDGSDNLPVYYELYRAPGDFSSDIVIPANKRGIICFGLEGRFSNPTTVVSAGGAYQTYQVYDDDILQSPIYVDLSSGNSTESWTVITDALEKYGPSDKVVLASFVTGSVIFQFGDNINGAQPITGQNITFRYRIGGGARGRIGVGKIDEQRQFIANPPASSPVTVSFKNPVASSGGTDKESLEEAKKRAPKSFSVRTGIVTPDDYANVAENFSHPVYGTISKAVATIRTSRNANLVEIYCLAVGPDGIPVAPSAGLKSALKTYYEQYNVLTNYVDIIDGNLRPVDVNMTVVMNRNVDGSSVKVKVEQAIANFFDYKNWQMGQPLYISDLISVVRSIDGVAYIDLISPSDNILPMAPSTSNPNTINFDELIVEGTRQVRYYYDRPSHQ